MAYTGVVMLILLASLGLFADGDNSIAAGSAVLACLMTIANGVLAWIQARDKLRFDSEKKDLEKQIALLTLRTEECHRDRDEAKEDLEEARKEIAELKQEVATLRKRLDERSEVHRALPEQ